MKKTNVIVVGIILSLMIGSMGLVSAQEIEISEVQPFDFISWFQHTFNIQTFSVVGDSRHCSLDADKSWGNILQGAVISESASSYCSSGHGLWNYFSPGWTPWKEYSDDLNVQCGAPTGCNLELYCCDNPEPTYDSQCRSWYGSDYEKATASCVPWINNGYKCTTIYDVESRIPYEKSSFNYCILGEGEDEAIDCYFYPGSGSVCLKKVYPGTECPISFEGHTLYEVKSTCEGNIDEEDDDDVEGCGDGICSTLESLLITPCNQDCDDREIKGLYTILNLKYSDVEGKAIDEISPGQLIKVHFDIRSTARLGENAQPVLVEAGLIPLETAVKWGMDKPEGFYSIFDFFVISESEGDACCEDQPNIADNKKDLTVGMFQGDSVIKEFEYLIQVPNEDTIDFCGNEIYWGEDEPTYVLYVIVKNGCYKDGYRKNIFKAETIVLNLSSTTTVGYPCDNDIDCEEGEQCVDIKGDWSFKKYCQKIGGNGNDNKTPINVQVGITINELNKFTSKDLSKSICTETEQCKNGTCFSLNYLESNEYITSAKSDVLLEDTSKLFLTSAGAFVGVGACIGAVSGLATLTGGTAAVLFPLCALTGAGVGYAADEAITSIGEALKKGDKSEMGYCIVEDKLDLDKYFKWAAWFDLTGDGKKDGTDGLIISIIMFVLLLVVLRK